MNNNTGSAPLVSTWLVAVATDKGIKERRKETTVGAKSYLEIYQMFIFYSHFVISLWFFLLAADVPELF